MLISIYPIGNAGWSFAKQPGVRPVRVKVPKGSELLPVRGLGVELFVPSEGDVRQRIAWSARQVMKETSRPEGKFKRVQAGSRISA